MRRNRSSIRIPGESVVTERSCTLRWQVSQILASALVLATPAMAQEAARSGGLEEVVVTAQRREERLQDAPLAISVLSSEKLELRGITDFSSVAEHTPSISFTPYPSSSNTLIMYLRGQGVADSMQITSDGSVGLYQDGFYISRPQLSTFDLADIDRVEVLRGPQGTLYGRNTTGGAVNLISKRPSGELGVKQALSAGSRDYFRTLTVLDLPEWHGLSSKLTFLYSRKDGLVENLDKSSRDYQEEQQRAGRVALAWDGDDDEGARVPDGALPRTTSSRPVTSTRHRSTTRFRRSRHPPRIRGAFRATTHPDGPRNAPGSRLTCHSAPASTRRTA